MPKKPFAKTQREIHHHIDWRKPVKVYRNLNRNCYSVMQDGIVRCHASRIELYRCDLKVSEAGRQRVLADKRKNVHAYVVGRLASTEPGSYSTKLSYDPYKSGDFIASDLLGDHPVKKAMLVSLCERGATCIIGIQS